VELFDGFKDNRKATFLGGRWERLILEVCDDYFFYNQVEEHNYSNVHALQEYDDGAEIVDFSFGENLKEPLDADGLRKLSHLHRYACHLYDQGLETVLTPDQVIEWCDLYEETDTFTDRWLSAGRQKLEELQRLNEQALQGVTEQALQFGEASPIDEIDDTSTDLNAYHFLVTSGTLIPSLVKCLLFKLNQYFKPSNIFSSREDGKLQCCRRIRDRFLHQDKFPKYCAIGDGPDEKEAARVLAWPFVNINTDPDSPDQLPQLTCETVKERMEAVYKTLDASSRPPLELSDH
jgi:EYA(Eyes Absent) family protein